MSVTTWRYQLRNENGEGWAIAFLDSIGCFTVLSDFGDYGYRWPERGWGDFDFRDFLIRCDDSYLLGKLAPREVYDGDGTVEEIKRYIIERRREESWSALQARHEWNILEDHSEVRDNEVGFAYWLQDTRIECAWEFQRSMRSPQAVAFTKHVMPRLRKVIRADLEMPDGFRACSEALRAFGISIRDFMQSSRKEDV